MTFRRDLLLFALYSADVIQIASIGMKSVSMPTLTTYKR